MDMGLSMAKVVEPYGLAASFERALVWLLCTHPRTYDAVHVGIVPEAFQLPGAQLLVRAVRAVGKDIGKGPSSAVLVEQRLHRWVGEGTVAAADLRTALLLLEDAEDAGAVDADAVLAELVPILKARASKDVARAAVAAVASGDSAGVDKALAAARRIGTHGQTPGVLLGAGAFDVIAGLRNLERLPTGVLELDYRLGGGMACGQLGFVIADSGGGKSMWLSQMAATAAQMGQFVGYVTLELPQEIILARIMAALTGELIDDITAGAPRDARAREKLAALQSLGICCVQQMTPSVTTVPHVLAWKALCEETMGMPMSVLVVDYGDRLGVDNAASTYEAGNLIFEALRVDADAKKYWSWTAAQSSGRGDKGMTHDQHGRKVLDMGSVADSINKVRAADVVVTLNPETGPDGGKQTVPFVAKNRTGNARFSVGPLSTDEARGIAVESVALGGGAKVDTYDGM